jgi:EAL domain-containing protein (putative c-di-GMP-specific phosphodiesterase class I)
MSSYQSQDRSQAGPVGTASQAQEIPGPALEQDVRAAIRSGQLRAYVQPLVDMHEPQRVVAAESLLRWQHPRYGVLAASQFLHMVERAGLLAEVDLATVAQVTADLSALGEAGRQLGRIWVNISREELFADQFLSAVVEAAERAGLTAGRVGMEIGELVMHADLERLNQQLARVRRLGVAIAVDHVGLDPSLPFELSQVPLDAVILDRSLIEQIDQTGMVRRTVAAIVALAHVAGAAVVAKGVERLTQMSALQEVGCDRAQGYLLGRPVPIGELLGQQELTAIWWG